MDKVASIFQNLASAAASRHYVTSLVTVFGVLGLFANIPAETQQAIITELNNLMTGLQQVFGSASKLTLLVWPIGVAILAKLAGFASSFRGRADSLEKEGVVLVVPEGSKNAAEAMKMADEKAIVVPPGAVVPVAVPPLPPTH